MDTRRIQLLTWNVACKNPECTNSMLELLGFRGTSKPLPDFYVVGLQEVKAQIQNMVLDALFDDPWTHLLTEILKERDYVRIKTVRLQGIVLIVYVLRTHLLSIRDMEAQYVKTGLGGFWGNKGCVSIRMNIGGVSVCLVNSHLAPHDHNLPARITDYNTIVQELRFRNQQETTMVFYHDYVFWIGDHNFRLDESISHDEVLSRLAADDLEYLLSQDQLKSVMSRGEAFSELTEPPFRFPPTFKFFFNSTDYDPKRRPAWTDRILYRVTENAYENLKLSAKPENYRSHPNYMLSDHKPVSCSFKFKTFSNHVDRIVEFVSIPHWHIDLENEVNVNLGDDVKVSDFDWIGLYKTDFSSLEDYLSFLYVNPRPLTGDGEDDAIAHRVTTEGKVKIRFPDNVIRSPGSYCLLYITQDFGSVLGISSPFQASFSQIGVTESPGLFSGPLRLSPLAEAARNMSPRRTPSSSTQPSPGSSPRPSHKRGVSPARSLASSSSSSSSNPRF